MNEQKLRMQVEGMTCDSCERHVVRALHAAGARDARADYRRGEATFSVDGGTDVAVLAQAVAESGYQPGPVAVLVAPLGFASQAPAPAEAGTAPPAPSARPTRAPCPTCGQRGRAVDTLTLKAMLALPLTVLRPVEYRFCPTPTCPTVYYSVDGEQQFGEAALRERVHQKHAQDDDVFACYCFRHTPGSIRAELAATGRSTAVEKITVGIQAEQCACEVRNPQGSCCLGNVRTVVRRVESEPRSPGMAI